MFQEANIQSNFTNHSLRASDAKELCRREVSKKIIQKHTGHRSLDSLPQYQNIGLEQKQATCNILVATSKTVFAEVQKIRGENGLSNSVPSVTVNSVSF